MYFDGKVSPKLSYWKQIDKILLSERCGIGKESDIIVCMPTVNFPTRRLNFICIIQLLDILSYYFNLTSVKIFMSKNIHNNQFWTETETFALHICLTLFDNNWVSTSVCYLRVVNLLLYANDNRDVYFTFLADIRAVYR